MHFTCITKLTSLLPHSPSVVLDTRFKGAEALGFLLARGLFTATGAGPAAATAAPTAAPTTAASFGPPVSRVLDVVCVVFGLGNCFCTALSIAPSLLFFFSWNAFVCMFRKFSR